MDFEWDDRKARTNLAKHDVSFEMATRVFEDPDLLEILDAAKYSTPPTMKKDSARSGA